MKPLFFSLFLILGLNQLHSQFFVQKLQQKNISETKEVYAVLVNGDTIRGQLRAKKMINDHITGLTIKADDNVFNLEISQMLTFAVNPDIGTNYDDAALLPRLREINNEEFIKVLPQDGWVIYERIRLPGKREDYLMTQLLNPGFDTKIKVYAHPDGESTGSTSIGSITLDGLNDNTYFVALTGERVFQLYDFQYRKRSTGIIPLMSCNERKKA